MFLRSGNLMLTFLLSYHVRVSSKNQVNFRYRRYSKVLMIASYRFLIFLHYLCFGGHGIYCRHSHWATMFEWPRKSMLTSDTGGTQRYWWLWLIDIWNFSLFMFSRSGNPLMTFLRSYRIRVISKIWVNFRFKRFSVVLMILNFHNFFNFYVFEVKLFIAGIPTKLPCLGDFEYPGQPSVLELLSMSDLENLQNRKLYFYFRGPSSIVAQ